MKNRILLFATLAVLLVNFSACTTTHHQKDDLHNNKTSANQRSETDHMHDNDPR